MQHQEGRPVGLSTERAWRMGIWILAVAALFLKGKVLYVMLYTLTATYFLSRGMANRSFAALQFTRELSVDHAFVGEDVAVTVGLTNPSRLPVVWVMASDETTHLLSVVSARRAVMSLRPGETKRWTYRVAARRRGLHTIGPIHLESGDAFGLAQLQGRSPLQSRLIVYPRIHALQDLGLPSSLPFGEVQTSKRFFDDPAHTIGTRPYQTGDPFKSIHWKVSARAGELYVKEYQPTIAVDTVVYLNLNENEYEVHLLEYYSELAIEAAASMAYALVQDRQSVGLVTNGTAALDDAEPISQPAPGSTAGQSSQGSPPGRRRPEDAGRPVFIQPRKGSGGVMEILEVLATIECAPSMTLPQLLAETTPRLNWGATLILITPVDSPRLIETLLRLRRQGFHLIVLIVGLDPVHKQYLHRPLAPGITFYHVQSPSELEAVQVRAG